MIERAKKYLKEPYNQGFVAGVIVGIVLLILLHLIL